MYLKTGKQVGFLTCFFILYNTIKLMPRMYNYFYRGIPFLYPQILYFCSPNFKTYESVAFV